jgi:hypothetical protein
MGQGDNEMLQYTACCQLRWNLAGRLNSMLRKRSKSDKALDAQLGQASWSLPGLMVADNMLYILSSLGACSNRPSQRPTAYICPVRSRMRLTLYGRWRCFTSCFRRYSSVLSALGNRSTGTSSWLPWDGRDAEPGHFGIRKRHRVWAVYRPLSPTLCLADITI